MRHALVLATVLLAAGCAVGPSAKSPAPPETARTKAAPAAPADPEAMTEVTDAETGQKLNRVPKVARAYYAANGILRNRVLGQDNALVITKEDAEAWYVVAPVLSMPQSEVESIRAEKLKAADAPMEVPAEELDVVTPPISKVRLGLKEISQGLPTAGYWRQNFAVADLDGDGKLEIVTPPARLTVGTLKAFKFENDAWKDLPLVFDLPEGRQFEYGGVAAADIDGDGRVDLVAVAHGPAGGPMIARNLGGLHFRVETKGMPAAISSRAVAIGDLNGDGRPDILTLADDSEYMARQALGYNPTAMDPIEKGLSPGYDVRSFMQAADGTFKENHVGLDAACFGYAVEIWANPPDGGEPFFATDCRYSGRTMVVYGYDRGAGSFHRVGLDFGEALAIHTGVGLGLYQGHPAAFMGYVKAGPGNLPQRIDGAGVSAFYREGGEWKRKRVVKFLNDSAALSQGIAVGDLDGDGLDDVAWADETHHKVRIFFQQPDGGFEELDPSLEPSYVNRATSLRVADVDGDGKKDIILMYETGTGYRTRSGGLRFFKNLGPQNK